MDKQTRQDFKLALWFNLIIGIYNIYLWNQGGWWFNIIVGALNIGAFVFGRDYGKEE